MPTLNNLNVVFIRDRDGNFTPINGFIGSPGRGIVSIERTSGDGSPGTVDTYTITYTDSNISTFNVTNGSALDISGKLDLTGGTMTAL